MALQKMLIELTFCVKPSFCSSDWTENMPAHSYTSFYTLWPAGPEPVNQSPGNDPKRERQQTLSCSLKVNLDRCETPVHSRHIQRNPDASCVATKPRPAQAT